MSVRDVEAGIITGLVAYKDEALRIRHQPMAKYVSMLTLGGNCTWPGTVHLPAF